MVTRLKGIDDALASGRKVEVADTDSVLAAARAVGGVPLSGPEVEALAGEIARVPDESERLARIRREVLPALAGLDPLAAGPAVKAVARALDVPVADLRREVARVREALHPAQARPAILDLWPRVDPWPDPVPLDSVLSETARYLRRYAVLPPHGAETLALWTLMTHAVEAFDRLPLLLLSSPAPRSGKSTVMELLARIVARPLPTVSVSPAALYRVVEAAHPTILLDEADSVLADSPDLTALINAAHARGSKVIRCHAETLAPEAYDVFTPVALAGNNPRMAPATRDRTIQIMMRRRTPDEVCERARARAVDAVAGPLARRIVRAVADALPRLRDADPEVPECLHDRAADCWTPLLALADEAGGDWPARARAAAVALSGSQDEDAEVLAVRLLRDLRTLFEAEAVDRLASDRICEVLCRDPEAPWSDPDHRLTPRRLARLLRPFGVRSRTLRLPTGALAKGYMSDDFSEAWTRYLSDPSPVRNVTTSQPNNDAAKRDFGNVTSDGAVTDQKVENPASNRGCYAVTDRTEGGAPDTEVMSWDGRTR
jgi:hypothetical protein